MKSCACLCVWFPAWTVTTPHTYTENKAEKKETEQHINIHAGKRGRMAPNKRKPRAMNGRAFSGKQDKGGGGQKTTVFLPVSASGRKQVDLATPISVHVECTALTQSRTMKVSGEGRTCDDYQNLCLTKKGVHMMPYIDYVLCRNWNTTGMEEYWPFTWALPPPSSSRQVREWPRSCGLFPRLFRYLQTLSPSWLLRCHRLCAPAMAESGSTTTDPGCRSFEFLRHVARRALRGQCWPKN